MEPNTMIIAIVLGIIFLIIFLYFVPVNLWITAIFSGIQIDLFELVFMRIRKVPPKLIIFNLIRLTKAGIDVSKSDLETHYLAGGNVEKVTIGLINAKVAGQSISWKDATAIDLGGKDIGAHLKNRAFELAEGIDELRQQLSSMILNDLTAEEVKEVGRVIENMKPLA